MGHVHVEGGWVNGFDRMNSYIVQISKNLK